MVARNIGAYINPVYCIQSTNAGSTQSGAWIDRLMGSPLSMPLSCTLVIAWACTVVTSETLTVSANIQDATDSSGTGAASYGSTLAAAVVATGTTGGSVLTGVSQLDNSLGGAREFVRSQHKLAVSASGTVQHSAVLIFGGFDKLPA